MLVNMSITGTTQKQLWLIFGLAVATERILRDDSSKHRKRSFQRPLTAAGSLG